MKLFQIYSLDFEASVFPVFLSDRVVQLAEFGVDVRNCLSDLISVGDFHAFVVA